MTVPHHLRLRRIAMIIIILITMTNQVQTIAKTRVMIIIAKTRVVAIRRKVMAIIKSKFIQQST